MRPSLLFADAPCPAALRVCAALLVVLLVAGCEDDGPLLFPPAAEVTPILEGTPSAEVGQRVQLGPVIRLQDRYGNPVAGVRVPIEVVAGDGVLEEDVAISDAQGRVALPAVTLDTLAGENRFSLRPPGLSAREVVVLGTPGPVEIIVQDPEETVLGEWEVGTTLETPLSVRLMDRFGNPVRNYPVLFDPKEGGGIAGEGGAPGRPNASLQQTDEGGYAEALWTLGTAPGVNRIDVHLGELLSPHYSATTFAGPLDALLSQTPLQQAAQTGEPVPFTPSVAARDRFGNPLEGVEVTFEVIEGEATVEPSVVTTDADGTATVDQWIIGSTEGVVRLRARAGSLSTTFVALAGDFPPGPQLQVAGVHLNQGSQKEDGRIAAVSGRDGLLRVFLTAPESLELDPEVQVEIFHDGTPVESFRIPAGSDSIGTSISLERLERSWNVELPGALVAPGMGLRVTVDPEGDIPAADRSGYLYPADGGIAPVEVVELDPLRVLLVPIRQAPNGLQGRVYEANAAALLDLTRRLFPLSELEWAIRSPYVTQEAVTSDFQQWSKVVNELLALRIDEATDDTYYYGVVQVQYTSGIAGVGFIPPNPSHPAKVSMGWDHPNTAPWVAAHELGHNLGRRHTNCGGPANVDPNAPPDGTLGSPGWDIGPGVFRSAQGERRDIMSYCRPEWVSDYTFERVLDWIQQVQGTATTFAAHLAGRSTFRAAEGFGARSPSASGEGLMVWGRIEGGVVQLEPAFPSEGPAVLPDAPGPHRIVGRSAAGARLFDLSFRGIPVDHAPEGDVEHFAFRIPLSRLDRDRLHRIELVSGGETVLMESALRLPEAGRVDPGDPSPRADRIDPERVRMEWDATRHPLAVVRDASGALLTLARNGVAEVFTRDETLEVHLSDGVRSERLHVEILRE